MDCTYAIRQNTLGNNKIGLIILGGALIGGLIPLTLPLYYIGCCLASPFESLKSAEVDDDPDHHHNPSGIVPNVSAQPADELDNLSNLSHVFIRAR